MSHIISIRTKVKNPTYVKKALQRMGINFTENKAKLGIHGGNAEIDIQFDDACGLQRQDDNTWAFVGDPYYSSNKKLRSFYNNSNRFSVELATAYAIEETKTELTNKSWRCIENEDAKVGQDQLITMVFEGGT